MGAVDLNRVSYRRPGGRTLFSDVSFRVGEGQHMALVGANGTGKTTLLRLIAGDEVGHEGVISVDGSLLFMPQFIGSVRDGTTVRDLLVSVSPPALRKAAAELAAARRSSEAAVGTADADAAGLRYARALVTWGDAGGYDAEVLWDTCATTAVRADLAEVGDRSVATLSGGEQKRLVLEMLLRSDADVLLLDEPDNYLDVPGKEWLEGALRGTPKTVLFVSHDRALLEGTACRIVTLEAKGCWTHGGSFATYANARHDRLGRLDEQHRRYQEERQRLYDSMREFKRRAAINDKFASKARAAETRLRRFETTEPPERAKDQAIAVRLGGGRTGKRALVVEGLGFPGLVEPFDLEVHFGERVGILGRNGTGKTHFLQLLAGLEIAHEGRWSLGARVVPGWFSQTHDRLGLGDQTILELLLRTGLERGSAMAVLRRYELDGCATQSFSTLSGGQQARLQILLLEVRGSTILLLDEPTDNLDLASAEALEEGLAEYEGTILAVTHDRWLMRSFDRFVVFRRDGTVAESVEPVCA